MNRPADPRTIGADTPSEASPRARADVGHGRASRRLLLGAIATALLLSVLAGVHVSQPGAADADIYVFPDRDVAVVLCVVDAAGQARCFAKDDVLAGALGGESPAVCGMAARPLASPCPAGRECAFRRVTVPADAFGLVLLEPRPPLFGVPRHRLIDAAVLASDASAMSPQVAVSVRSLARCFAPSGSAPEPDPLAPALSRRACEDGPCRLHHASVRVAARSPAPAIDRRGP